MSPADLLPGAIHAWYLPIDGPNTALVAAVWPHLTGWERDRLDRFAFEADRTQYAAAHWLVRVALADAGPLPPTGWVLRQTDTGRPLVETPLGMPPRHLSLSHTRGLVACAISSVEVGIDVEYLDPRLDVASLLTRVLSPAELARWPAGLAEHRGPLFFQYWTLKEAVLKGLGIGLACEPSQLEVEVGPGGAARLTSLPVEVGRAADWSLSHRGVTEDHTGALAIRAAALGGAEPRWRSTDLASVVRTIP